MKRLLLVFFISLFSIASYAQSEDFNKVFDACKLAQASMSYGTGSQNEIEEAATIDGCSPLQCFFRVVFPILKPTAITVAILNAMWIWNDYLLPYLILGTSNKTIPVAIQIAMQGAYGDTDMGGFMAMLVLAIIPIIVFYLLCQKHIIKGVIAGAVKG